MRSPSTIAPEAIETGEVFTKRWIVDLILDLAGYTADRDLATFQAVEPACGGGAFLVPIIERLSESLRAHDRSLEEASDAIRAFDLLEHNVDISRGRVAQTLTGGGWDPVESSRFAEKVVNQNDYLRPPQSMDELVDDLILKGNLRRQPDPP